MKTPLHLHHNGKNQMFNRTWLPSPNHILGPFVLKKTYVRPVAMGKRKLGLKGRVLDYR